MATMELTALSNISPSYKGWHCSKNKLDLISVKSLIDSLERLTMGLMSPNNSVNQEAGDAFQKSTKNTDGQRLQTGIHRVQCIAAACRNPSWHGRRAGRPRQASGGIPPKSCPAVR
ncbi:hypothetical protein TNCV_537941 [Trichonephila clavipes]|nr:hypothetical protein TNCV_537941 [Trichonephila clavipes]